MAKNLQLHKEINEKEEDYQMMRDYNYLNEKLLISQELKENEADELKHYCEIKEKYEILNKILNIFIINMRTLK